MGLAYARVKLANPRLAIESDLVVHPATRQVIPNPANPNIAGSIVMNVRYGGARGAT